MKKITLTLSLIALAAIISTSTPGCTSKNKTQNTTETTNTTEPEIKSISSIDTKEVTALYFHASRRCATCEAVEKVSKEAINEFYKGQVKFYSINREENKELAQKYQIKWQALILVKNDQVINLTNDAFLNARNNPDKLKSKIKTAIDQML